MQLLRDRKIEAPLKEEIERLREELFNVQAEHNKKLRQMRLRRTI